MRFWALLALVGCAAEDDQLEATGTTVATGAATATGTQATTSATTPLACEGPAALASCDGVDGRYGRVMYTTTTMYGILLLNPDGTGVDARGDTALGGFNWTCDQGVISDGDGVCMGHRLTQDSLWWCSPSWWDDCLVVDREGT